MSVFLSSGSPSRRVARRRFRRSTTASATDSCTSSREPAQQTWPWLKKMPFTIPSTAWSSGSVVEDDVGRLAAELEGEPAARPGEGAEDLLAHLGRAGEGHLVEARVPDEGGPGLPVAGHDVDDARRQVGLLADLGQEQGA